MIRTCAEGLCFYRFATYPEDALIHAAFTRLGGASRGPFASLNVGHTVGDDPAAVAANHAALYRALGVRAEAVVSARQVHGARVVAVSSGDGGAVFPEADALISNVPGLLLFLRFADCVPVFFYAPRQRAVGLAHAGWQGTLKSVAKATAQAMIAAYGCRAEELQVGLGPAIGPCCFEVGPDVLDPLRASWPAAEAYISRQQPDGKAHLDLWQVNALQLRALGIERIESNAPCTCCQREEFYSHRGEKGHTGRFAAVMGLRGG